ncbi:MAG: hypothetical protein U0802_01630 [Candidatus Binatia bacterium]
MTGVDRFLDHFADFGRAPDREVRGAVRPADGTVLHPGMTAPLHRSQVRAYMTTYLAGVPGFRFEIAEWAERDGTVFVEARNSGRPGGGERLEWGTVCCVRCAATASCAVAPTATASPCWRG